MDSPKTGKDDALAWEQFEEFYAATVARLRSYIRRVTANQAAADDILQESYVRILNAPPMAPAQRRSYLYRVATNLIIDHERTESRQRRWRRHLADREMVREERLDVVSDVHRLFARLNVQERALLWLAYVEGAEHREIAAALRLREKSVKVLLYRARRKMEGILHEHGYEAGLE